MNAGAELLTQEPFDVAPLNLLGDSTASLAVRGLLSPAAVSSRERNQASDALERLR